MKRRPATQKLAQQLAQQNETKVAPGRKWERRVLRRTWDRDGRTEVAECYSVRLHHQGRREWVGLQTADLREAAKRAKRFHEVLKANGWDAAFRDLAPEQARIFNRRETPTVGDLIREADARAVNVKPATLRGYGNCLRQLAALVAGIEGDESRFDYRPGGGLHAWRAAVDAVSLADLTPRAVEAAGAAYVKSKGATDSAKRTLAAMLRQARGFWSRKLRRVLPFDELPNPFEGVIIESPRPPRYLASFDSTALVTAARAELRDADLECWKALLLTLGAGLRRGEADRLQWAHVDFVRGVVKVLGGKTRDSSAEVPLSDEATRELERLKKEAAGLYVLEGRPRSAGNEKRRTYGAQATWDRFIGWLKDHGVDATTPSHALRKEAGSLVNAAAGIHAASRFLRHAGITITAQHYLDDRKRVVVPVFDSGAREGGAK